MTVLQKYTLAIETATNAGSISLYNGDAELSNWTGGSAKPLSSELLPQIAIILESHRLTVNEIELLVACSGPGSFTGVRIGLAAAMGLQTASNIKTAAVSLLDGLAAIAGLDDAICLVPAGRTEFYYQRFTGGEMLERPSVIEIEDLVLALTGAPAACITTADAKFELLGEIRDKAGIDVVVAKRNIASALARMASDRIGKGLNAGAENLSPIYVKEFGR
jgi:tRNA threonylcarbamoyladenosine biosynthesis protein TsaB